MLRRSSVRCSVAVVVLVGLLVAASTPTDALARRHRRNHRASAPASQTSNGGAGITLVPSTVKLTGTGAFSATINGDGLPINMPVTINTSTLDAVCSSAGIHPKFSFGVAIPSSATTGTDGRFVGSLAGVGCRPGLYAVAAQEQAAPYQTFVALLTLTL